MANPITVQLPADLPTNWVIGQTVAPNGQDVGLDEQHGYNYLMEQVNAAQTAAKEVGEALDDFSSPDSVTIDGGGEITPPTAAEGGPYEIIMTEDEGDPLPAEDVSYDNDTSGMTSTTVQGALDELAQGLKDGTITSVTATATAAGWSGDIPVQTISVAGLPATGPAWIGLSVSATPNQRDAARKAVLSPTARAAGSITVTADGAQPTIDLPVTVYYVKEAPATMLASIINMFPGGSTLQVPLDAPTSLAATAGNAQVELTWVDPLDKYATPEGEVSETGDQLVSEWSHTVLVRKTGSQPAGPDDGTVVVSSSVRNQYQTTPYTDTGLTNDTQYFYGVFAYNKDGVASAGAFTSATPKAGTPLSELTEGTIIKINENGSPVEFYLAKHNYEPTLNGQGRELVVRKVAAGARAYNSSGQNDYPDGTLDVFLNGSYKNRFSEFVQSAMGETKFSWYYGGGGYDTLSRSIFILSSNELGMKPPYAGTEGTTIPIASTLQKQSQQWTRSIDFELNSRAVLLSYYDGVCSFSSTDVGGAYPSLPCLTLPSSAYVDSDLNLVEPA